MVPAGEEQPDLSLKMNAGNVASVATGPTNAKNPVVDAVAIAMEEEGEAAQEDAEADLLETGTRKDKEAVAGEAGAGVGQEKEDQES